MQRRLFALARLSFPLASAIVGSLLSPPHAFADNLTWDAGNTGNGATIDALSGAWNTTAGNIVWNNAGSNVIWSQTSTTDGSNAAIFAGADGTLNQYVVTLGSQMAAESVAFNSSGYQITGSPLALIRDTTLNGSITVAANKTATINSQIVYNNNQGASISVGAGGTLNLGGGATNSQYQFGGAGIVNMSAGTYNANTGFVATSQFNQSGGTFNITPGNGVKYDISSNSQSVNYTLSGTGTLTVNNNAASGTGTSGALLRIGNGTTAAFESKLTIQTGGTLTVGTSGTGKYGELEIAGTAASNAKFDVQGGTVTIGSNPTSNKIYFFKNGADATYAATMTQSGGTVTANGIQFGGTSGTYNAASSATLTLSGGSLYVGLQGITKGSGAAALPVTIQLQGGTLGADQNWSSSLDMKLGTTGGGPTIRSANAANSDRTITLSGNLSNDGAVNGTLKKTGGGGLILGGTNSYSGGTTIDAGRLFVSSANALPTSGNVQVNAGTLVFNVTGSFNQSISLASGAALSVRQAATTLGNVTLPTAGSVIFNNDDVATAAFSLGNNVGLTGNLTVQVGGNNATVGAVTLGGDISGSGVGLTKTSTGTLTLAGTNTYTGRTSITGGTLLLGVATALPASAPMTLGGGTDAKLATGGFSNSTGILTLGSGTNVIDFGGGLTPANTLTFSDTAASGANSLQIWNWSGTVGSPTGGLDKLILSANGGSMNLANINFYSGEGGIPLGGGGATFLSGGSGELVPVPEPSALVSVAALLGVIGMQRRRSAVRSGSEAVG